MRDYERRELIAALLKLVTCAEALLEVNGRLLGALLVAVGVVPSQAQAAPGGPTIIYSTHNNWMVWAFVDEPNPTKLAVLSSDPEFFTTSLCVGEDPQPGPDRLLVKRRALG